MKMNKTMNDEQFSRLWAEAEAAGLGRRLAKDYPAWVRRRRRNGGLAVMTVAVLALAVPLLMPASSARSYDSVVCNRSGIDESQWVDLAAEMLTI